MTSFVNKVGLLSRAKANVDQATAALEAIAADAFPTGSPITWKRGGHIHRGYVSHWAYGHCWANNTRTSKEVKISITDILAVQQ